MAKAIERRLSDDGIHWETVVVDENGGGGGTPNLTAVLTAGTDAGGLDIENAGNITANAVLNAGDGGFQVGADASVTIDTDDNDCSINVGTGTFDVQGNTQIGPGQFDGQIRLLGSNAIHFYGINAAPALLVNGGFSIWLDPANGATKLMIRGCSNDGTIVNGEIALS